MGVLRYRYKSYVENGMKAKTNIVFTFCILSFFYNQIAFAEKTPFIKELELLDKFGGLDVPSEQILANPVDIAISDEGLIYILDSEDNDIKIFKQDGTFIKRVGRRGNGPGEFVRPWAIYIIKDEIYIADAGNKRVQILSIDGKYLRGYKAPIEYGAGLAFDSRSNLYLNTQGIRRPKLISVYDTGGNLVQQFGNLEGKSIKGHNITLIKNKIKKGKIPDSFKNDLLLTVDKNENLFAVHRALKKYKKYSLKGELLDEIEIKTEEYQKIYENFRKKNKSEKSKGIFWYLYYIYDLAMDERGNLFILLNEPSRMIIYVYSNDGVFKRKLLGVEDSIFRIEVTSNNHMYALSQETHLIYKFKLDFE